MIKKTIGKLRRQPKNVREGIAFWSAGVFAFMVFVVWLFNAPTKFSQMAINNQGDSGTISSILEDLNQQVATVKESLPETSASSSTTGSGENALKEMIDQFQVQSSSTRVENASTSTTLSSQSQPAGTVSPSRADDTTSPKERFVRIATTTASTSGAGR